MFALLLKSINGSRNHLPCSRDHAWSMSSADKDEAIKFRDNQTQILVHPPLLKGVDVRMQQ